MRTEGIPRGARESGNVLEGEGAAASEECGEARSKEAASDAAAALDASVPSLAPALPFPESQAAIVAAAAIATTAPTIRELRGIRDIRITP